MTRTSDITTFTDCRQKLREHLDRIKETGRPLYITTNGEPDAVLLSPEAYDALMDELDHARSLASIDRGMNDGRAGRTKPFRAGIDEVADDLGLDLA